MTRMWIGIEPEKLCKQHLLGEHKELHQLVGHLNSNNKEVILGHLEKQQIHLTKIQSRHQKIVEEMKTRGYNHDSPLGDFSIPPDLLKKNKEIWQREEKIKEKNRKDLDNRCPNF